MRAERIDVLLVDDDREDYLLTEDLLRSLGDDQFRLEWIADESAALGALTAGRYAACLLDQRLTTRTGLEFMRDAIDRGCPTPVILLTGSGDGALERRALIEGAADYLDKGNLDAERLGSALRHAVERGRALAALRERERLFRAVFEISVDAMVIFDDALHYLDGNRAALALFGVTHAELLQSDVGDFSGTQREVTRAGLWQAIHGGAKVGSIEVERGGGRRTLEYRLTANVLPGRHLSVLRDLTDTLRARETQARLAALVCQAEDAIVVTDLDGNIREWNPGAEAICGCATTAAISTSIRRFVPDDQLAFWRELLQRLSRGQIVRSAETTLRRTDGRHFDVAVNAWPLRDGSGRVEALGMLIRDVTETKKLRARLAIADRVASVGTLAAGVAHEINNPLAAVIANVSLATRELREHLAQNVSPDAEEILSALSDTSECAHRVRQIVQDLKLFSRSDNERRTSVDVACVLENTVRMVWNEIRHRARLVKDFGPTPSVDGNEGRLAQVFLNLLVNAAQAIEEGHAEQNEIRVASRFEEGRVVVEISDTGSGIRPEFIERIFEPFFTTKPVGQGTGLGLSICHGIVTSFGGELSVKSELGRGTTFRVSLPPGEMRPESSGEERVLAIAPGRPGRILLIDDEPMLVNAIRRSLSPPHEVIGVTDAREALERLRSGEQFDVVLCDLMMPDLTGMELYGEIQSADPLQAGRFIFLTGGAFTPQARTFLEQVPNARIEKPFDTDALLELVDRRIQAARARPMGTGGAP